MNVWSGRNYLFQSRTRCLEEADSTRFQVDRFGVF